MEAKRFLMRVHTIERIIDNKRAELEKWQALAVSLGCLSDGERVQSSGNMHKMEDAVCRCVEIEEEINNQMARLQKIIEEINAVIEQLSPKEYDLIHRVYIQDQSLAQVAKDYGKSYSWATTTQNRAFNKIREIIKEKG